MYRTAGIFVAALLSACASSPDSRTENPPPKTVQVAPEVAGDLIVVADVVSWPSKLWFCPVSTEGAFEKECARSLRLPRTPGSTNSVAEELFSFDSGPDAIGKRKKAFRSAVGEMFAVHPSVAPASGRYALVRAFDQRGAIGARSIGIRTKTYVFEARPNLVAILPGEASPLSDPSAGRAREVQTVRGLLDKPTYTYETMTPVRIECDRTGIIYGGDGKERCKLVP